MIFINYDGLLLMIIFFKRKILRGYVLPLKENSFDVLNKFDYVYLDGNFQSLNLIPDHDFLSRFFINKEYEFNRKFNRNECILNIRGGDYLGVKKSPAVPFEYWYKVVEHLEKKVILINSL